jgi:hypothetical protein
MFRAFCNKGIMYDDISDFEGLVELGDLYCALPAISEAVEFGLLKWLAGGSDRWQTNAPKLAVLAYKLRAEALYHDAFVHLVGSIMNERHAFCVVVKGLPLVIRLQVLEEYGRLSQYRWEIDRAMIRAGGLVTWSHDLEEQKFYETARGKLENSYGYSTQEKINELLKKNLKYGYLKTKIRYLLCAKLERYPWEETDG